MNQNVVVFISHNLLSIIRHFFNKIGLMILKDTWPIVEEPRIIHPKLGGQVDGNGRFDHKRMVHEFPVTQQIIIKILFKYKKF